MTAGDGSGEGAGTGRAGSGVLTSGMDTADCGPSAEGVGSAAGFLNFSEHQLTTREKERRERDELTFMGAREDKRYLGLRWR